MSNVITTDCDKKTASTWLDRIARGIVARRLGLLRRGRIMLRDGDASEVLGQPGDLQVELQVLRPRFFRQAILGGSLAVAESYIQGDWECDDLTNFFRIFLRNMEAAEHADRGLARWASWMHRMVHAWKANTLRGSRRNIAAHYDLGNDFYRLWLDDTLAYSCGVFTSPADSLRAASIEKFDRVCRKLDLSQKDHVLEIGTGWGGFALHAASNYGCRVTTTTISSEQFNFARQRIADASLSKQVDVLQTDYRDLRGEFDKLVSIEMIEAVGYKYFDHYFRQCGRLLRADGSFALQAIVMPERGYPQYLRSADFIQRYIFPGGCLPSLAAILESVARTTDLRFVHAEDFAPHYAETLRRWRQAFLSRLVEIRQLGYSSEFIRMWNYYLCYCEAAFAERYIGVLQIQFDKPGCLRDPIEIGKQAAAR